MILMNECFGVGLVESFFNYKDFLDLLCVFEGVMFEDLFVCDCFVDWYIEL